jgi:hypothetical protein
MKKIKTIPAHPSDAFAETSLAFSCDALMETPSKYG